MKRKQLIFAQWPWPVATAAMTWKAWFSSTPLILKSYFNWNFIDKQVLWKPKNQKNVRKTWFLKIAFQLSKKHKHLLRRKEQIFMLRKPRILDKRSTYCTIYYLSSRNIIHWPRNGGSAFNIGQKYSGIRCKIPMFSCKHRSSQYVEKLHWSGRCLPSWAK